MSSAEDHESLLTNNNSSSLLLPDFCADQSSQDIFRPLCTEENIVNSLSALNEELVSIGMMSVLPQGSSADSLDVTRLINAAFSLIERFQKTCHQRDKVQDFNHRITSELEFNRQERTRLKTVIDQLERELALSQQREKHFTKLRDDLCLKLKTEKEECKRLQSVMQNRETQHKHSLKKLESECEKLKERLHMQLVDRIDRKISITVSEMLSRADGKRGRWKKGSISEDELFASVIATHDKHRKELMIENNELRQALVTIQDELQSVLGGASNPQRTSADLEPDNSSLEDNCEGLALSMHAIGLSNGHYQLPYSIVRDDILSSLLHQIRSFKAQFKELEMTEQNLSVAVSESRDRKHAKEVERLHKKIERYRTALEQCTDSKTGSKVFTCSNFLCRHSWLMWFSDDNISEDGCYQSIKGDVTIGITTSADICKYNEVGGNSKRVLAVTSVDNDILDECKRLHEEKKALYDERAVFDADRLANTALAVRLERERVMIDLAFKELKTKHSADLRATSCDSQVSSRSTAVDILSHDRSLSQSISPMGEMTPSRPGSAISMKSKTKRLLPNLPASPRSPAQFNRSVSCRSMPASSRGACGESFFASCHSRHESTPLLLNNEDENFRLCSGAATSKRQSNDRRCDGCFSRTDDFPEEFTVLKKNNSFDANSAIGSTVARRLHQNKHRVAQSHSLDAIEEHKQEIKSKITTNQTCRVNKRASPRS